jgi:FMN reductase
MDVLLVAASPRSRSRSSAVLSIAREELASRGIATSELALRDIPPDDLVHAKKDGPELARSMDALDRARGVVIATPIYKASFSGLLKIWLDALPQYALSGKIVLPLATGATLTSVLTIDYALRPVLQSMAPRHVVGGYFVLESWMSETDGRTMLEPKAAAALHEAVTSFERALGSNP